MQEWTLLGPDLLQYNFFLVELCQTQSVLESKLPQSWSGRPEDEEGATVGGGAREERHCGQGDQHLPGEKEGQQRRYVTVCVCVMWW